MLLFLYVPIGIIALFIVCSPLIGLFLVKDVLVNRGAVAGGSIKA